MKSSELGPHPADDLEDDPGAGLLEHADGGAVGDALQALPVHGQQAVPTPQLPVLAGRALGHHEQHVDWLRASLCTWLCST